MKPFKEKPRGPARPYTARRVASISAETTEMSVLRAALYLHKKEKASQSSQRVITDEKNEHQKSMKLTPEHRQTTAEDATRRNGTED